MLTILDISKSLFGLLEKFTSAKAVRKNSVADLFTNISQCLNEILINIESNNDIVAQCSELSVYFNKLKEIVTDVLSNEDAEDLYNLLSTAVHARQILIAANKESEHGSARQEISEAAGIFKAMANTIRGSIG